MTRYGRSPWIDGVPKTRVPSYPRHSGKDPADVVIIGGGLTGCAAAQALAAAGQKVVLLEADRIGRGTSGTSTGWIADDPGVSFQDLEKALGLKRARWAFQAWRRAARDLATQLRRLNIKCALEPALTLTAALSPEQAARLGKEYKSRKAAGLDVALLNARAAAADTGIERAVAGVRTRDGAVIDPYRATLGFAAAAKAKGAKVFEQSPARRVTFTRKIADVWTAGGTIRTRRVVVATGVPTVGLHKSLRRHFWFHHAFLALTDRMPAPVRKALGRAGAVRHDASMPPHTVRWVGADRVLVCGADAPEMPDRLLPKAIVQRTGQLMYELSTLYPEISGTQPAFGWSVPFARTADFLPYIGPHRNFPFHVFAWGDSSHGVTGAYLAGRIITRYCLNEMEPADAAFDFNR